MNEIVHDSGIFTVDAGYVRDELAAIHLVLSGERVAIVDTGTQHSVRHVETALKELNLGVANVDYIVLTHVHLDHAGGAGALMARCENAQLVVHERGARHMVDPGKLVDGTIAVYGQAAFNEMYGDVVPVEAERVIIPQDGESIDFNGRSFTFLDSPGHARHHHCIFDEQTHSVFTGDTLGISYPGLRHKDAFFLMPTTTPVQFEPDALHASIDKVMALDPSYLYLTHYSAVRPTAKHIDGLHLQIDEFVRLTEECAQADESAFAKTLTRELTEFLVARCCAEIPEISPADATHWIHLDARLNAQGLVYWWNYRRN